jgi:hypothetical protein
MYKAAITLLAFLIALPLALSAVEYDLNNYIVPDYHERALSISLKNSAQTGKNYMDYYSGTGSNIKTTFSEMRYSRQQNLFWQGRFALVHGFDVASRDDSTFYDSNNSDLDAVLDFTGIYRYYFLDNWFSEFNLSGNYSRSYDSEEESEIGDLNLEKNDNAEGEQTGEIGFGYGRRQDVTCARQAIYILEELDKAGQLLRKMNNNDVTELADLLVTISHVRQYDSRIKVKDDLRLIVNHLIAAGLLQKTGIENFLIIRDMYHYGNNYSRTSGWDISTAGRLTFYQSEYDDKYVYIYSDHNDVWHNYDNEDNRSRYGVALKFNYSHNYGKNWELDIASDLGYFQNNSLKKYSAVYSDTTRYKRNEDSEEIALKTAIRLNWYISTRTRLWAGVDYVLNDFTGDGSKNHILENTITNYDYNGEL